MARRNKERHPARALRLAVDRLPMHTKEAMLEGISRNRIIVGAYVDPSSGGICPMLAAHRNGGRTDVATFARAWDAYTDAKGSRRATRREVTTLTSLLQASIALDGDVDSPPMSELAGQIRAERERLSCNSPARRAEKSADESAGVEPEFRVVHKPKRGVGARASFGWLGGSTEREAPKDLLAAAEEQLSGTSQPV
ncbi:hypothetical protein BH10ACT11_BH10ACT11_13190 [soil metagenome]